VIIELNGHTAEMPEGATVADAVKQAGADDEARGVAVAVDGDVVRKADWDDTKLADRQAVEVVRAVQGG
jgi:sulfur carrier protein